MYSQIKVIHMENGSAWDNFAGGNPNANPYHLFSWLDAINDAYGHKTYALAAIRDYDRSLPNQINKIKGNVVGILPLIHLNNPFFGNRLISIPYFDHGGVLAEDQTIEEILIKAAVLLGQKLKSQKIELRHLHKIVCLHDNSVSDDQAFCNGEYIPIELDPTKSGYRLPLRWSMRSHKVRLIMPLFDSSEALMKSFKSKLRSQIKRPIKAGLKVKIGGRELIEDFYQVFSVNMHDLGSPVHAKPFILRVIEKLSKNTKIVVIYNGDEPVAASVMVGFKDIMINPWASALRQHSKLSPNMLLYWSMLSYACDNGYRSFDFGRSTPDEGTYRFKRQWGAETQSMYWYTLWLNKDRGKELPTENLSGGKKRLIAVNLWRRLPISLSRVFGPMIRKHIDL